MRFLFLIVTLLFAYVDVCGQTTTYLDHLKLTTKNKKRATYVKLEYEQEEDILVELYSKYDMLLLERYQVSSKGSNEKNGFYEKYRADGKLKSKGFYQRDEKVGIWHSYFEDGNIRCRYSVRNDTTYFIQYFTTTGDSVLSNGTGVLTEFNTEKNRTEVFEYVDSLAYASYYVYASSGDTVYNLCNTFAEYKGGLEKFFSSIKITYPKAAFQLGITGIVYVGLIIDEKGNLKNTEIVRGIGAGCDEEAVRATKRANHNWKPAIHEGKPVTSLVTLPIRFTVN